MVRVFRVAVIGAGVVGGGVINLIKRQRPLFRACNFDFEVKTLLCRDPSKARDFEPEAHTLVTSDASAVAGDASLDIVVEVAGGTDAGMLQLLLACGGRGVSVVTANKALLAEQLPAFRRAFTSRRRALGYEASVAGGIPVIRALQHSLLPDTIQRVQGILNGTSNYILSAMEGGQAFAEALRGAQAAGFAEADPTADVQGLDARNKLVILTQLAYGIHVHPAQVRTAGITGITPFDVSAARASGYSIKHLGVSTVFEDAGAREAAGAGEGEGAGEQQKPPRRRRQLDLFVSPALVPLGSSLAATGGAGNLVQVDSLALGRSTFGGAGAGREPTANSVLADMVAIAKGAASPRPFPRPAPQRHGEPALRLSKALRRDTYVRGPPALIDLLSVALWRQGRTFSPAAQPPSASAKAFFVEASAGELEQLVARAARKVVAAAGGSGGAGGGAAAAEEEARQQTVCFPVVK